MEEMSEDAKCTGASVEDPRGDAKERDDIVQWLLGVSAAQGDETPSDVEQAELIAFFKGRAVRPVMSSVVPTLAGCRVAWEVGSSAPPTARSSPPGGASASWLSGGVMMTSATVAVNTDGAGGHSHATGPHNYHHHYNNSHHHHHHPQQQSLVALTPSLGHGLVHRAPDGNVSSSSMPEFSLSPSLVTGPALTLFGTPVKRPYLGEMTSISPCALPVTCCGGSEPTTPLLQIIPPLAARIAQPPPAPHHDRCRRDANTALHGNDVADATTRRSVPRLRLNNPPWLCPPQAARPLALATERPATTTTTMPQSGSNVAASSVDENRAKLAGDRTPLPREGLKTPPPAISQQQSCNDNSAGPATTSDTSEASEDSTGDSSGSSTSRDNNHGGDASATPQRDITTAACRPNKSHGHRSCSPDKEELARAAAVLMSFCPTPGTTAKRRTGALLNGGVHPRNTPGGSPANSSAKSSAMDCTPSSSPSSSSAAAEVAAARPMRLPPPTTTGSTLYPEQVAFLTSVGDMAKQLALRRRRTCRAEDDDNTHSGSGMDANHLQHEVEPLSVKTLVRGEGQGVRLRLVPDIPQRQGNNKLRRNMNSGEEDTEDEEDPSKGNAAHKQVTNNTHHRYHHSSSSGDKRSCSVESRATIRYDLPVSVCTVLSSYAPYKASYWEDDRLVEPYLGECYDNDSQHRRSNRSDDNNNNNNNNSAAKWEDGDNMDDDSCYNDSNYGGADTRSNTESYDGSDRPWKKQNSSQNSMRSYGKMLSHHRCRNDPVFRDAFFLDSGNISEGERRKKLIVLQSYRASVISFVEKKVLKKDINNDFYVQHPELEIRGIKLTHVREIRADLLHIALEENSPIEMVTVACANWYFERLVMRGMVGKRNQGVALAACILLAVKFIETGDIHRKIQYVKTRFRQDEAFGNVTWQKVQKWEFRAYVGLEFTLMPENGNKVIEDHLERLLGQINLTSQEYYSKKFALP